MLPPSPLRFFFFVSFLFCFMFDSIDLLFCFFLSNMKELLWFSKVDHKFYALLIYRIQINNNNRKKITKNWWWRRSFSLSFFQLFFMIIIIIIIKRLPLFLSERGSLLIIFIFKMIEKGEKRMRENWLID